jgi:peptide/nickel transport system substrate-binding protein
MSTNIYLDTLKEGPLQDKRVRQAINYAVDKEAIIKFVLDGYGHALGSPLTSAHSGYDPNIKPYPYDPEKAKALLKEAGYGNGFTLTFNSPSGRYPKDKEFAEAITGQLAKIGINVKLQVHEWGNYVKLMNSPGGAGPMFTHGWAGTFDADGNLTPLLSCGEVRSTWCNKQFDSLLKQARATLDQKKREQLYSQACKLAHDEAPWLFLFHGEDIYAASDRVQNWKPTSCPTTSIYFYMYGVSVKD